MTETNRKIIDAVIRKAEKACPDSLALIGLYGSAATGDLHPKSDLDLLILINDESGSQLADAFILQDTGIGYDLYCTTWAMLEEDAQCSHAYLSKLLDSPLVYVKDQSAVARLEELRSKARALLASDNRYEKAQSALENAKHMFANCFLTDDLAQIRTIAGAALYFLLNAVMLHHGSYFRKGIKRTFEEIAALDLPFDMPAQCMAVIQAENAASLCEALTILVRSVQKHLVIQNPKAPPTAETLSGTYEEMFSNWRNKMLESCASNDLFSSFMNMVSFQFMHQEIAAETAIEPQNVMAYFDVHSTANNAKAFDDALNKHLQEYQKAGIQPKRFADTDDFVTHYQMN